MITITFDTVSEFKKVFGQDAPEGNLDTVVRVKQRDPVGIDTPPKDTTKRASRSSSALSDDQRAGPGRKSWYRLQIENLGVGLVLVFEDDQGIYVSPDKKEVVSHQLKRLKQLAYVVMKESPHKTFTVQPGFVNKIVVKRTT